MKTRDGKKVKTHDVVWVIGSCGIHKTEVNPPVTGYELFGLIPVDQSFSTKKAAQEYKAKLIKTPE